MWITIVIVVLAAAMMLGPIMMMQPSKRQRRLARLRAAASRQGLNVRMTTMPPGAERAGEPMAVYAIALPGKKPLKQTWLLARQAFSHGLHFQEQWDWVGDRPAPVSWQEVIRKNIQTLPTSVLAVEATGHSLGVYWLEYIGEREPEAAVEELDAWLKSLLEQLPKPLVTAPAQGFASRPPQAE